VDCTLQLVKEFDSGPWWSLVIYHVEELLGSNSPPRSDPHVEALPVGQPSGKTTSGWLLAVDTKTVMSWEGDPTRSENEDHGPSFPSLSNHNKSAADQFKDE